MANLDEPIVLSTPDIGNLLSELIKYEREGCRLIFVEYDPSTRALYNHIGIPGNEEATIKNIIFGKGKDNDDIHYSDLPKIIAERFQTALSPNNPNNEGHKEIEKKLRDELTQLYEHLKTIGYDGNPFKFLEKVFGDNKEKIQESDDSFLYNLIKISEMMPSDRDSGGCGKKRLHEQIWDEVINDEDEIENFKAVAAFETIFGIRFHYTSNNNQDYWGTIEHARLNLYLETGEYAGQIIAFRPKTEGEKQENEEQEKKRENIKVILLTAIKALEIVKKILPNIRQAKYIDKILQGGQGNVEHILLRYLPVLLAVEKFYVRFDSYGEDKQREDHKYFDKSKSNKKKQSDESIKWIDFFNGGKIFVHDVHEKNKEDKKYYAHFESKAPLDLTTEINRPEDVIEVENQIKDIFKKNETMQDKEFFFFQNYFGFSKKISSEEKISRVSLIAKLDEFYFRIDVKEENREKTITDSDFLKKIDEYLSKVSNEELEKFSLNRKIVKNIIYGDLLDVQSDEKIAKRKRAHFIHSMLSILLNPGDGLLKHIRRAQEMGGKTYSERYGEVIYSPGYLDIDNIDSFNATGFVKEIYSSIKDTYSKLTDTLWAPRGYRGMSNIISVFFFKRVWFKLIASDSDPSLPPKADKNETKGDEKEFTPLGHLLWNALDFEDTLNMDSGYREHFIHSFHVFLLGIHLMKKLPSFKHLFECKNDEKVREIYLKWFLAAMYHDIGYPIEKIENISQSYIKKLLQNDIDNSDIECKLNPDWSSIIRNKDFVNDFYLLSDKFIDTFLYPLREEEIEGNDKKVKEKDVKDVEQTKENFLKEQNLNQKENIDQDLKEEVEGNGKKLNEKRNVDPLRENLFKKLNLDKEENIDEYFEFAKKVFRQLSFNALTKNADHGIFSALLFLTAAKKDNKLWAKHKETFYEVAVAIFAHNTLDRSKKRGEKWHLPERFIKYNEKDKKVDIAQIN
ncbi:MAG: hypothetical protein PVH61_09480 [Candidatus Aminicenantes bacterium]|jgi:hypothetical protein